MAVVQIFAYIYTFWLVITDVGIWTIIKCVIQNSFSSFISFQYVKSPFAVVTHKLLICSQIYRWNHYHKSKISGLLYQKMFLRSECLYQSVNTFQFHLFLLVWLLSYETTKSKCGSVLMVRHLNDKMGMTVAKCVFADWWDVGSSFSLNFDIYFY